MLSNATDVLNSIIGVRTVVSSVLDRGLRPFSDEASSRTDATAKM